MGELVIKVKEFLRTQGATLSTNDEPLLELALERLDANVDLESGYFPSMKEIAQKRKEQFEELQKQKADLIKAHEEHKRAKKVKGPSGYSMVFENYASRHSNKPEKKQKIPPSWRLLPGFAAAEGKNFNELWDWATSTWHSLSTEQKEELREQARALERDPQPKKPKRNSYNLDYPSMRKG